MLIVVHGSRTIQGENLELSEIVAETSVAVFAAAIRRIASRWGIAA